MNIQKILSNYYMTSCDNSSIFTEHFAEMFGREILNSSMTPEDVKDKIVNDYSIYCHFFDREDNKKVEDYVKELENNLHSNSNYFIIIPRFNLPPDYKEQILERISSLSNVLKIVTPVWDLAYTHIGSGLDKVIFIPDRTLFTYEIDVEALYTNSNSNSFISFGSGPNLIDDKLMDFYKNYFASSGLKSVSIKLYCNDITENIETISEFTERFLSYCNNKLYLESFNFPTLPNRNQESHFSKCKDSFADIFTYENIRDDIANKIDSYFKSMWYYQEMGVLADLSDDLSSLITSAVSKLINGGKN